MKKLYLILCLIIFSLCSFHAQANLVASINTPSVQEGEVFQLTLTTTESPNGQPDITPLKKDFDVVGQSQNQSYQFINGKTSQYSEYVFNLIPIQTGLQTIPSINWGKEKSNSLKIQILPISDSIDIKNEQALLIEAQSSSQEVFEGSGFVYQIAVFERVGVVDGQFYPPTIPNAEIIPLGKIQVSQKEKDGILYQVLTQKYNIFPQTPGELEIKGGSFKGYYISKSQKMYDFLNPVGFDSPIYTPLASGRKDVQLQARPLKLNVLNRPSETLGSWWLPSSQVDLHANWTNKTDSLKVGESISLEISLSASNVLAHMLPNIDLPQIDGLKIYPEPPQKKTSYLNGQGLIAEETRVFVMVPSVSGEIKLPQIVVPWFNTNTKQIEQAIIPSEIITVQESTQKISQNLKSEQKISAPPSPIEQRKEAFDPYAKENSQLYFLSGLFLGLILMGSLMVLLGIKKVQKKELPKIYPSKK